MFILDTNILSAVRRFDRAPHVRAWLSTKPDEALYLSAITLGEIERGIRQQERTNPPFAADLQAWLDRTVLTFDDRVLPFEAGDARIWGRLSAELGHSGADLMIAATALSRGATVVTRNVADFSPTGVPVVNPFE
jgi:hypothetical protein